MRSQSLSLISVCSYQINRIKTAPFYLGRRRSCKAKPLALARYRLVSASLEVVAEAAAARGREQRLANGQWPRAKAFGNYDRAFDELSRFADHCVLIIPLIRQQAQTIGLAGPLAGSLDCANRDFALQTDQ